MTDSLPRALASFAIALCLRAPACGGDSEPDRFSSDYNAAIKRLDKASEQLTSLEATRRKQSSRAIARELDRFADVLAGTRRELASLEPPQRATRPFKELVAALDDSVAAGHKAASAARAIQPAAQRRALRQLRDAALEIARAQDALGRAVNSTS